MHATFHGGPADGGTLLLREPIPSLLRLPADPRLLIHPTDAASPCWRVGAVYRLALDARGEPDYLITAGGGKVVRYLAHVNHQSPAGA